MRPNLTRLAINRALNWSGLKKLIVIIDGLRNSASNDEQIWRRETIEIVESFSHDTKIELWVYEQNVGITEHQIRIQKRALQVEEHGIWLEEDMEVDFDAYTDIQIEDKLDTDSPLLFSGFSEFNHKELSDNTFKSSLFVPIWGLTINANLVELVEKVWRQKKYNPEIVENSLIRVFSDKTIDARIHLKSIERFWVQYMSWGFSNPNRWDALAIYSLWTKDSFVYSPMRRLVNDVSFLDHRGMNQRKKPNATKEHNLRLRSVDDKSFCLDCEIKGSRIEKNLVKRGISAIKYKVVK